MSKDRKRLEFLGELAAGLAHELRNPLSTIRLQLELMQEDLEEEESETCRRAAGKVDMLLGEVNRMHEIVQEFLNISKGHDLKLTAVEIEPFLRNLIALHRPDAERHGVNLTLRVHNELETALIDRNYFHAAISNLVRNAIQACEPKGGGHVWIEAGRAHGALGISVIDTGVGISENIQSRIFRAYFTSRENGTGMGLPLTRRIVEEHGGQLAFDSVEDQGSRFMVMLPVGSGDSLSQLIVRDEHPFSESYESEDEVESRRSDSARVTNAIDAVMAQSRTISDVAESELSRQSADSGGGEDSEAIERNDDE